MRSGVWTVSHLLDFPFKRKKVVLPSNIKYCSKLDKLLLTTIATTNKNDLSKGERFWSSSSSTLIHPFK